MTTISKKATNSPIAWVSYIFHPSWVGGLAVLLTIYLRLEANLIESAGWVALMFFIATIPLLLSAVIHSQSGSSAIGRFGHRYEQYILSAVSIVVLLIVIAATNAPPIFASIMYAAGLTVIVSGLINHFVTKISRYALVTAGSAAVLMAASIPIALIFALIALVVGWARVQLGYHTWMQVGLGYGVTAVCVAVTFLLTI